MSFFTEIESIFTSAETAIAKVTVQTARVVPLVESWLGAGMQALKSGDPAAATAVQALVTKVEAGLATAATDASVIPTLFSDGIALYDAAQPFITITATVLAAAA